ncbi:MAG: glycosyltransferase family 2 protein [Paracoccaceae bacterium]
MGSVTVLTTMKNEAAFLLDWVAHYKALGADHLWIAQNDCADPTPAMIARLEEMGLARGHATRNWSSGGIQRTALRQARWYPEVTEAEWLFVCDADEFLTIHLGDGSFRALIAGTPGTDVIGVSWRIFGSAGRISYTPAPVPGQFLRCEPPPRVAYTKCLFRRQKDMARIGIHMPHPREGADLVWAMAGGGPWRKGRGRLMPRADYAGAQVNHYALRAMHSFLVKRDRGRVNHANDSMDEDYWARFDLNGAEDHAIARYAAPVAAWRARLLADPVLGALQAEAEDWHRARIAELLARPDWAALAARLAAMQG